MTDQRLCPFCRKPGARGTYDDEVGAYAHVDCSLKATQDDIDVAKAWAAAHPSRVER